MLPHPFLCNAACEHRDGDLRLPIRVANHVRSAPRHQAAQRWGFDSRVSIWLCLCVQIAEPAGVDDETVFACAGPVRSSVKTSIQRRGYTDRWDWRVSLTKRELIRAYCGPFCLVICPGEQPADSPSTSSRHPSKNKRSQPQRPNPAEQLRLARHKTRRCRSRCWIGSRPRNCEKASGTTRASECPLW